jgi:hypothetical protein
MLAPPFARVGVGATFSLAAAAEKGWTPSWTGVLGVKGSSPLSDDEHENEADGDDDIHEPRRESMRSP